MENKDDSIYACGCTVIHEDVIARVREKMPAEERLYDLADFFKTVGDSTRVKILYALSESEMCVCDLAALHGMTVSAISHQLRVLKQARLIKNRKAGKVVYYALNDAHVEMIFKQGMAHVDE